MIRSPRLFVLCIFLLSLVLSGCPKKVVMIPPIQGPPVKNPVTSLLEAFAEAGKFQSNASIRVEMISNNQRMNFLLNGTVLYEKPDKLRILGYHPLGMGVFDALYRGGEFFLLVPTEKKAYTGAIADFEDLMERAGVRILTEKTPGIIVPTLVRIGLEKPETRVDLRLREIDVNSHLPEDAFRWLVPEGADVIPLTQLLKKTPS
jgi:outer membrane lipoprotein-sorting protein